MDTVLIILAVLFVIGTGVTFNFYVKGHTRKNILSTSKNLLKIVSLIVLKNVPDEESKRKMRSLFQAVESTIRYIERDHQSTNLEEKKVIAIEQIHSKLKSFGVELDEEDRELIDLLVDNALDTLKEKEII